MLRMSHSRSTLVLAQINDDSDDDDTPGPGSSSSAPDNRAMDPGLSSVPWPSRSSTPDNESDANPTPRASPSPGPALHCSTRIKKPPVEFWKLPKDQGCPMGYPYGSVKIFARSKLHIRMQIKIMQNLAIH